MRKIIVLIGALLLTSCMTPYRATEIATRPYSVMGYAIHVVTIEGCEYILVGGIGLVHKENCKFHDNAVTITRKKP